MFGYAGTGSSGWRAETRLLRSAIRTADLPRPDAERANLQIGSPESGTDASSLLAAAICNSRFRTDCVAVIPGRRMSSSSMPIYLEQPIAAGLWTHVREGRFAPRSGIRPDLRRELASDSRRAHPPLGQYLIQFGSDLGMLGRLPTIDAGYEAHPARPGNSQPAEQ
jgi:hypothetical protein